MHYKIVILRARVQNGYQNIFDRLVGVKRFFIHTLRKGVFESLFGLLEWNPNHLVQADKKEVTITDTLVN